MGFEDACGDEVPVRSPPDRSREGYSSSLDLDIIGRRAGAFFAGFFVFLAAFFGAFFVFLAPFFAAFFAGFFAFLAAPLRAAARVTSFRTMDVLLLDTGPAAILRPGRDPAAPRRRPVPVFQRPRFGRHRSQPRRGIQREIRVRRDPPGAGRRRVGPGTGPAPPARGPGQSGTRPDDESGSPMTPPMPGAVPRTLLSRRTAAMLLLGFSSGLPLALVTDNLQFWMTDAGLDLGLIGAVPQVVAATFVVKVLLAPFLDRFAPPFLDRRRGWILVTQLALAAAVASMALFAPERSLGALLATAVAAVVVAAAQDVVVDAWRAEAFDEREVGAGAAAGVTGYRIAMLATGAGALWLTGAAGLTWPQTYLLAAAAVGVGIAGTFLAPAPARVAPPSSVADAVVHPLREFLSRRGAWAVLAFILVFKLPDVAAGAMTGPFLVKLGFPKEEIAAVRQGLGMLVTIAGTLAGGVLVTRLGLRRSLWVLAALQAASNLGFWALSLAGPRLDALTAAVVVENFCAGLVAAGFVGFLTAQCHPRFAAFQYALLSALMAAFRLAGAPAGYAAEALGWPAFFVATALLGLPGMVLLPWIGTRASPPPDGPPAQDPAANGTAGNSAAAALGTR